MLCGVRSGEGIYAELTAVAEGSDCIRHCYSSRWACSMAEGSEANLPFSR